MSKNNVYRVYVVYDRIIRTVRPFSLFPCIVGFIEFECGRWTQVEYLFRIVSPASLN